MTDTPSQDIRKHFPVLGISLLFSVVLFVFTDIHWADKTSTVTSLMESMFSRPHWIGHDIPCITSTGALSSKPLWAEEPPVFHALGAFLKWVGFTNIYGKLLALLSCIAWALGTFACLQTLLLKPLQGERRTWVLLAIFFTPMIMMHGAQPLPDDLMAAFLAWSLYFFFRRSLFSAFVLATLAVTLKALPIFPILPVILGYLFLDQTGPSFRRRFAWATIAGLTVVPMALWLGYLAHQQIDNPFFSDHFSLSRHTGGSDLGVIFTFRYWWRYFTWMFYQGVSLPIAILSWIGLGKIASRWKQSSSNERILFIYACFSPVYWAVVRGPQFSAPWYSFSFMFPFTILGCRELALLKNSYARAAIALLVFAYSVVSITPTSDLRRTLFFDVSARPIELPCGKQGIESNN